MSGGGRANLGRHIRLGASKPAFSSLKFRLMVYWRGLSGWRGGAAMSDLLPCPFCGGEAFVDIECERSTEAVLTHNSKDCPAGDIRVWYSNEAAAIAAWNTCAPVKVKPLVWQDFDGQVAKATAMHIVSYLIRKWSDGRFEVPLSCPCYGTGPDMERWHPTLEAAKAACQEHHEKTVRSMIE